MRIITANEWRIWEQNASPIFLVMALNAGMKQLRDYFGTALWTTVIVFEKGQGRWLFRPKELKLLGQKMIDFLLCPPFRVAFFTGYKKAEQALLREVNEIQFSITLEELPNEDLIQLFEQLAETYYDYYKYGWFCEPVQFQVQDLITTWLQNEVEEERFNGNLTKTRQALFTIEEDTFAFEILQHLAECSKALRKALRNDRLLNALKKVEKKENFPKEAAEISFQLIRSSDIEDLRLLCEKIRDHSARFYWKQNNYFSARHVTEIDVLTELFSSEDFDVTNPSWQYDEEIKKIQKNKKEALSEKASIIKNLPSYHRNLIALMSSVGGSLIDRRKKSIMIANGAFDKILKVIAHRTKTDISNCRMLIPQELRHFVLSPRRYHRRFEERKRQFMVFQGDIPLLNELFSDVANQATREELDFHTFHMTDPFIAEGKLVDRVLEQINSRLNLLAQVVKPSIERLSGVSVYFDPSHPKITGLVTVVKNPKTEILKTGEILVAPSTTPDYMDAIRKCKAIVTDWGGQTSHAAIVSRELRKPCIIGTNYASQILKNGDIVEINFEKGAIEIIKELKDR